MWARIRWGLIISGILVLVVFSLANTAAVDVRMPLMFQISVPLAMLLALAGLIGFMVGALWTAWMLRRRSAQVSKKGAKPIAESPITS
ncbi:lipopolysaccharide assembly protein LapA domain-containing protein [Rhodopirellula sp. MGV]|uniref:lipopolysaccharide assembly protein LapA domain-containing protein n=1 Tax=Rhodopirellula sp. MGV TaxID=2023130 RepID=UPI000B95F6D4|nr:lipopolysaccharide assembly protein LapA domain-containing protein [Rhodopirellula sp. MGV]OYP36810.1 hypothetical protein CGZ80_07120 [Rhodopirellula sp. MGV]PNY36482.1 DUF1049 domain-containing protein [Rhodopirellula baltica]